MFDRTYTMNEMMPALHEVSDWNVGIVKQISADHWDDPGLGEWTLVELVAHTSRAYTTVVNYLRPFGDIDLPSPAAYFRRAVSEADAAVHAQIADRGRNEATALREDPASVVAERAAQAVTAVQHATLGSVAKTPIGTLSLANYLATRVVELTAHTIDIVDAGGLDTHEAPATASRITVQVLVDMVAEHSPSKLIRTLTGRATLPAGFNVFG